MPQQQPQSWGGEAAYQQGPPSSQQGMGPGFDPGFPLQQQGQMHGGYPSSGQHHAMPNAMPNAGAPTAFGPASQPGYPQMQHHQAGQGPGQTAPWSTQPTPPPAGMTGPSRFTPQVILLVVVGAVCLAIFVIGIVLFVTTKF